MAGTTSEIIAKIDTLVLFLNFTRTFLFEFDVNNVYDTALSRNKLQSNLAVTSFLYRRLWKIHLGETF